jgi:hypothetical protein
VSVGPADDEEPQSGRSGSEGPGGIDLARPTEPDGPGGYPRPAGPSQPYDVGASSLKRQAAALILALAGGLVAISLVVIVVSGTDDDPDKTSGKAAHEAGQNLRKVAGLSPTGTYGGGHAMFTVTRAGSARGTYTAGGKQVSRVDVGSTTYLNTDASFWKAHGESSAVAARADGAWAKAPYNAVELGLGNLSPDHLGQNLRETGNDLPAERTAVNGVKAIKLTTAGLTYFISTSEPRSVLRVQGSVVNGAFSFDVTPVPSSAMNMFFTMLRNDVQHLKDAYNPNVVFQPTAGRLHFSDCGESGCTVKGKIEPDAWGGSGAIHVVTTVDFKGTTGGVVSRCSDAAMATSKFQVGFSCRTGGSRWTSWYRSHTGPFTIRASPTFEATVNSARDVSHLLIILAQEQQAG